MNFNLRKFFISVVFLSVVLYGMTIASCSSHSSDAEPNGVEKSLFISFKMITGSPSKPGALQSRAGEDASQYVQGSGAENYIDPHDIRYVIFDGNGNFLSDLTPKASVVALNDDFTLYEVTAEITDEYFMDNINNYIDFYLLVIANHNQWNLPLADLHKGVTLSEIFHSSLYMSLIPDTGRLLKSASDEGVLHFPLAGLRFFRINGLNLLTSTPFEPYNISADPLGPDINVNLLRALAKIEVVDRINIGDDGVFDSSLASDPLRISSVTLNGFVDRGAILPDLEQWKSGTRFETLQVTLPTVPATAEYRLPPALASDNSISTAPELTGFESTFVFDKAATDSRPDKCPVYSCYVYEYSRSDLESTDPSQYPYLTISLPGTGSAAPNDIVFPLRLKDYSLTPPAPVESMLRNNIYRYEISGIAGDLKISWTVCPMDQATPPDIVFN